MKFSGSLQSLVVRVKRLLFFFVFALSSSSCTNKDLYYLGQGIERSAAQCELKDTYHQYRECSEQYEMTFKEYQELKNQR